MQIATAPENTHEALRRPGRPLRILVADDEVSIANLLAMTFRCEGWVAATSNTGLGALELVTSFRPDLIILDVMLPDMDGFEVLARMRAARDATPVLFLSAKDGFQARSDGLAAGASEYMTKPFSLDEVVTRARLIASSATAQAGII